MKIRALLRGAVVVAAATMVALAPAKMSYAEPVQEALVETLATNVSETQAYSKIVALKSQYPNGMRWTNDQYYYSPVLGGGYGCAGFSYILSDAAFGNNPATRYYQANESTVRVGDILRINNDSHSVVALNVRSSGVTVAEGNINSSIYWGRTLSWSSVQNGFTYGITRYASGNPEPEKFQVKIDKPDHGEISVSPSLAASGEAVTVTVSPDEGFQVASISVMRNGFLIKSVIGSSKTMTFTMPEGTVTVSAKLEAIEQDAAERSWYVTLLKPNGGGTLSASGNRAQKGEMVKIYAKPYQGYRVDSVSATDGYGRTWELAQTANTTWELYMPDSDVTVSATFIKNNEYRVSANKPEHAEVYYFYKWAEGSNPTVTVDCERGYSVTSIKASSAFGSVDLSGPEIIPDGLRWSFVMPASDVAIDITVGPTATAQPIEFTSSNCDVLAPNQAEPGETVSFFARPKNGYYFRSSSVRAYAKDGSDISLTTDGNDCYYFTMPDSPVSLECSAYSNVDYEVKLFSNGSAHINKPSAMPGEQVTLTVAVDKGYEVKEIAVVDEDGRKLSLTPAGNNTWTFIMPEGKISVDGVIDKASDEEPLPFVDIDQSAWYIDAVRWAYEHDVMGGYSDGSGRFDPNGNLTRAQAAQILYNMAGKPDVVPESSKLFSDCHAGEWYDAAVTWAAQSGVFAGYSDGTGRFGPNDKITREQMAVVIWRNNGEPDGSGDLASFPDGWETSAWAAEGMQWAVGEGLLSGYDNTGELDPTGLLTRAQAAAIMMRWIEGA